MNTIELNFIETKPGVHKEKVSFGTNNTLFEVYVLLENIEYDLSIMTDTNIVSQLRNVDPENTPFADLIKEKEYERAIVKYVTFQVNNNVDKQQLSSFTIVSGKADVKHTLYLVSNKTS